MIANPVTLRPLFESGRGDEASSVAPPIWRS